MINSKINELVAYSKEQRPLHNYDIQPFVDTVKQYLQRDRSSYRQPLHELQIALLSDLLNRGTEYKNPPVELKYGEDYPPAYNDLRKLFYQFPLLECDNETFFSAWQYSWVDVDEPVDYWRCCELVESEVTDEDGNKTTEWVKGDVISSWDNPREITVAKYQYEKEIITGNTLISQWILDINENATPDKELSNIESLKSWLCNASVDAYDLLLWEEMGETVKTPNTQSVAKIVFIDKKLKECKEMYNLPIHIPTYI